MQFTKKQLNKIKEVTTTYDTFVEDGVETSLGIKDLDYSQEDIIYQLIECVGYFRMNGYPDRALAFENLTIHLITDTVIPIDYYDEHGITTFEVSILVNSTRLQEAFQTRFNIENDKRILKVANDYKKKYKHH